MKLLKKIVITLSFSISSLCAFALPLYNPVVGGEAYPSLYSPYILGGGISSAGAVFNDFLPSMLAVNPALAAGEENPILDLSYILLSGIKKERGTGHVVNAGFVYPANWGVIAGNLNFTHARLDSLNFGTFGEGRFSYSKDITENFYIGAGAYFAAGTNWSLGADIGILYKFPDKWFFKDSRFGVSITGIGKPFNPNTNGVRESGKMIGYPTLLTPHVGFATTFVKLPKFKMGMYIDASAPLFCNLTVGTGLDMLIVDMVSIRAAYNFNLLETLNKKQTHIPSFGIGLKFKISPKKKENVEAQDLGQTVLIPQFAVKPFYNNIWGFGFGITTKFGTEDREGPKIEVTLKENMYISPNNDGLFDAMELPLKITDKRYITSWTCLIKDKGGNVVRTIENKKPIRELTSAAAFLRLLRQHKGSIEVPPYLRWDGMLDSGETAEDGEYSFVVQATDDNHNFSQVGPYSVIVDNTPPLIKINEDDATKVKIFSPDGDGNKDEFVIAQNGSKEDEWKAVIFDNFHRLIRTFTISNDSPHNITWDGKDEKGEIVSDGVYSYTISSTDRAGNESQKTISNIIVDTKKPVISLNIYKKFFSPNGDGVQDTLNLNPMVNETALVKCSLEVKNKAGKTVRGITLNTSSIQPINFDGKGDSGKILDEGAYYAVLQAEYNNGYVAKTQSPEFIIDNTPPKANVKASAKLFSPDGDGKLDSISFMQEGSSDSWVAKIFAINGEGKITGEPLAEIDFAGNLPKKIVWTGLDKDNVLLKDGKYGYVLQGVDEAGNRGESNVAIVALNTEKADLILQSDLVVFSPNNDGVKDFLTLYPIIRSRTPITSYKLVIASEADGSIVNVKEGEGAPPNRIIWRAVSSAEEGEGINSASSYCKDGFYRATLEVELENKQTAFSTVANLEIDTTYPSIELSTQYLLFSGNENSKRHLLPIAQKSSIEELWEGKIKDAEGKVIKTVKWQGEALSFEWDALDDAGNKASSGTYIYEVSSTDKAGNTTVKTIKNIELDDRLPKVYITQELLAFSPNGDDIKDEQTFSIHTNMEDGIEKWSLSIKNVNDPSNLIWLYKDSSEKLPKTVKWQGKEGNKPLEGNFIAELEVEYTKGDSAGATSHEFLSSVTPPRLSTNLKPRYFSPDNDGTDDDLFIKLGIDSKVEIESWSFEIAEPIETGGKHFWGTKGSDKIAEEIIWDGRSDKGEVVQSATDYPFTFTATDILGLSSTTKGYIPVDILIIRDGDKLKIAVPSIIFRPNANDFKGLGEEVVGKNYNILKRVAQILNKFTDYQVQVEGHANSTTGTEEEEKKDLIPLSTLRAQAVMQILIKNGVKATRLSAVGMGGSHPVASLTDKDNWWKNRRVEFILIK